MHCLRGLLLLQIAAGTPIGCCCVLSRYASSKRTLSPGRLLLSILLVPPSGPPSAGDVAVAATVNKPSISTPTRSMNGAKKAILHQQKHQHQAPTQNPFPPRYRHLGCLSGGQVPSQPIRRVRKSRSNLSNLSNHRRRPPRLSRSPVTSVLRHRPLRATRNKR